MVSPVLRRGDVVAVVSPASAADGGKIERGVAALQHFGYRPQVMPHAIARGPLYYAGEAGQRVADLEQAFADPEVRGILCTRGGWGSAELLPLLSREPVREMIRANPKVFVGFSDHTALQSWFWNEFRMVSLYAPMVAADWSVEGGVDEPSWLAASCGAGYTFGRHDGLRTLRPGEASGRLLGGCLAILEAALGTPWALRLDEPCVLFLEDIGVKPYQWDRMLQHLKFAGVLEHVTGIVLGDMSANVEPREMALLEAACLHALKDFAGPIALGLRCGHVSPGNRSLALGAEATLCCGEEATLKLRGRLGG